MIVSCPRVSAHRISFSFFFFFKQKTAYELRISDWSSDVCSSDLLAEAFGIGLALRGDMRRIGEGTTREAGDFRIALERARRQPCVDDGQRNTAPFRGPQPVRP